MSRIGNFPVEVPSNVEVQLSASEISVKGPLGTLTQSLSAQVTVERVENQLQVKVANDSTARQCDVWHGARAGGQHGARRDQGIREKAARWSASATARRRRATN